MSQNAQPLRNITCEALAPLWARHDITTARIAEALGVSRQALSAKAKTLGLPSRAKVRKRLCDDETFARMWRAGVNTADMARHFGYSHRSCIGIRAELLGLPRRTRGQNTGNIGGWVQTISLDKFLEQELAAKMKDEAQKRRGVAA